MEEQIFPGMAESALWSDEESDPMISSETLTKGMPSDPDVFAPGQSQWHLVGTWGLYADQVWNDYTGSGVLIGALDDGFEYTHSEFGNYRTDLDYDALGNDNDAAPGQNSDRHGTSVMGTMIADDNGTGTVGVAFDADGVGIRQGFGVNTSLADTVEAFQHALAIDVDVLNNSWGFSDQFVDDNGIEFAGTDFYTIRDTMIDMTEQGRGGLGMNIVFSAGNDRTAGDNVNYHNLHNSPYTITVGAIDSDGTYSSFSTPGAAILTSAGGTLVYTTDRAGVLGYNGSGDYTNFSGTSASAPVVSGMVALLLEANPDLGWRDVQEIIAYSSQHNDPGSAGWQYNGAGNWNGGGLHFSHDYGFGAADAFTAVRLAETWNLQQTSANMVTTAAFNASPALAIADNGTVQTTINVGTDIEIEHVLIHMDIDHTKAGDLAVTLISPDGTESLLVNRPQNGAFTTSVLGLSGIDFDMTSVAHWGESSAGTWTLRIEDKAGGNTGILNDWSLQFLGNNHNADDLYIFTDDFGAFIGAELTARSTVTDSDGGTDTLNLAAVTSNSVVNLGAGSATIAGKAVTLAGTFENVYTGDGDDTITGNASVNYLYGGRGDDTLTGSAGNDTLDGGAGTDMASYLELITNFTFNFVNATTVEITNTVGGWMDTVLSVENFSFTGGSYTRAELETYAAGGPANVITGTAGADSLMGTTGVDDINGGNGDDRLYGQGGNDILSGGGGEDRLSGGDGNDVLNGGAGKNFLFGGAGNDTGVISEDSSGFIVFRENSTYVVVTDTNAGSVYGKLYIGNDVEFLSFDDVTLDLSDPEFQLGGAGWGSAAAVYGTAGGDYLNGTEVSDEIYGGDGGDRIYGKNGGDTLYGENGADYLYGDGGNDILRGGAGNDIINGGDGDDTLDKGTGSDRIYGGSGADTAVIQVNSGGFIVYRDSSYYITVKDTSAAGTYGTSTLYNDVEFLQFNDVMLDLSDPAFQLGGAGWGAAAAVNGTAAGDLLQGSQISDEIHGGDGADRIYGNAGDDLLYGDAGNDTLSGGDGSDVLIGGAGADKIYGGGGNDVFGFTTAGDGIDTVYDFAAGDVLNVTDILSGYMPGSSDISEFVTKTQTSAGAQFAIDSDGGGDNFTQAFTLSGVDMSAQSVQDLLNAGVLAVNQPLP